MQNAFSTAAKPAESPPSTKVTVSGSSGSGSVGSPSQMEPTSSAAGSTEAAL